jgi:(2Fe-2S) ferredoxin
MIELDRDCLLHIFVCVNQRHTSKDMPCCHDVGGEELYIELKKYVMMKGYTGRVWVTRTRCLGFCNAVGATVVMYPDGRWFERVTQNDLEALKKIIDEKVEG